MSPHWKRPPLPEETFTDRFGEGEGELLTLAYPKPLPMRLDRWLVSQRTEQSRARIQKFIDAHFLSPKVVDDENSVLSCFTKLKDDNRTIDLLFNNAGIIDWEDMNAVTFDSLEKVYRTNLIGALLVLRASLPCLRKSTDPLVINLSSRLGSISLRGNSQLGGAIAYQCSKAALNMLTKQASIDLAALGIRVISLSPGWVRTEMGGSEAKYEVRESVRLMLQTLDNLNSGDSGVFLGEDGSKISW